MAPKSGIGGERNEGSSFLDRIADRSLAGRKTLRKVNVRPEKTGGLFTS